MSKLVGVYLFIDKKESRCFFYEVYQFYYLVGLV